jgi:hypothetical protein
VSVRPGAPAIVLFVGMPITDRSRPPTTFDLLPHLIG